MAPKLLLTVLISSLFCSTYAQQPTINGQVKNEAGNVLAGATVLLNHAADSGLAKTAITSTDGNFEFTQVKPATYFISISYTGYAKISTPLFTIAGTEKITGKVLVLKLADKKMQGVTVRGTYQKPMFEVTADKIIFNVESSINATGSNAFELLQKSPGVATDKDDNISLKGKNGVRIYIDGRPTQMEAADLAAYLKSINSVDIASIEMISNPSARYDAAGNAGIINIRLKKNNTIGFTGLVSAGLNFATHAKTNNSLSLNYRNKAVNFFSNYSYNWSNNDNTFDLYRIQNDTLYDQKSFQNIKGNVHNIKAGADFFASKKSTIGFIYTGNFTDNTTFSSSRTPSSSVKTGMADRILYATNTIPGNIKNENINVNYRYEDTTGHEVNIDLDHGNYTSRKNSYQPNAYYTPNPETLLYQINYGNNTPVNITINTQKIDYSTPFKKGKFSTGAKISNVKTDNTFNLYNIINTNYNLDLNRSNIFLYKENINAGYINYSTPLSKKINIQAGIRVENTVSKSMLTRMDGTHQADDNVNRNYTDFFPSAAFTYTVNADNTFDLNYSRRIDRPNYSDLNPFETRVDELTYIKGNAFLRPQYTNALQLSHTFKSRYITTAGYSHISDYSAYIIDTAEITRTYISKRNMASQDIASVSFSVPVDITKWWNLYASTTVYNSRYHANFGLGKVVDINVTSLSFNAVNTFKLGNGFTGELSGFYSSPSVSAGTFKSKGLGSVDIGIQKRLLHDNATVKLSCTDVLHTLEWNGESNYSGTHILAHAKWESRQFRINFSYRFGRTQVKQERQRVTGNEDEKLRTSSGGGLGN